MDTDYDPSSSGAVAMQVIGAGLPRTGTTALMFALEQLGFAPCYHMRDLLADLPTGLPLWEAVADGKPEWEQTFRDVRSTCDWPSARYWRELMDHYPEAKVVLSVRPAPAWVASMRQTVWGMYHGDSVIHHVCEARAALDPDWRRFMALMRHITWKDGTGALPGDTFSDDGLVEAMERWNARVVDAVAPERLLVWDPSEGYPPLCEFLRVPLPGEPLPRINDTTAFREGIIGGGLGVLNEWWAQRDASATGLHGAELK